MLQLGGTFFGTCTTNADETAKVVGDCPGFVLYAGASIYVKFTNTNTASVAQLTLNVNGTGAHSIKRLGTTNLPYTDALAAGMVCNFVYDGTNWLWVGQMDSDTNTVPSAFCKTDANVAGKTAICSNYLGHEKQYLHILMASGNTLAGSLTLDINGNGAKPIYINGLPTGASNYTLPSGTYLVYFDGTRYQFRTDGLLPGIAAGNVVDITNNGSTIYYTKGDGTTASFVIPHVQYYAGDSIQISTSTNEIINTGVRAIGEGQINGTINVNTGGSSRNVSVKGLGSAAFESSGTFAQASHTHGNINNLGELSNTDVTVATRDKLLVADASDDNKLVKTSIAFDTANTGKFLSQAGTWEAISIGDSEHAASAGYALYAASAGYAMTASYAVNANEAIHASSANYALTASYSVNSYETVHASSANYAITAARAVHASSAGYAATAGSATDNTKVLKAGDTMSGNLAILKNSATEDTMVSVSNSAKSHNVQFKIDGSSGSGGLWDETKQKWIVEAKTNGSIELYGHASCASYATSSNTSITASNSVYAASAGYASKAGSAGSATEASHASSANYAVSASSAGYALVAKSAGLATSASNADYALSAGSAGSAGSSNFAGTANFAITANYAYRAVSAERAIYASSAGYAASAGKATLDGNNQNIVNTYATKSEMNSLLAGADAMIFKGTLGTGGTITSVPTKEYQAGHTYKVITNGTYAGHKCEAGDLLIAIKDGPASGTTVINADWTAVQTNLDGTVIGPTSSTSGSLAIFSGTTGKAITGVSSKGSSTLPIYIDNNGIVQTITSYQGTSAHASSANYAKEASHASSSTYSVNAGNSVTAGRAVYAASAAYATTAGNATDATKVAKTGDTMSGTLTISKAGEIGMAVKNTTRNHQVEILVGDSGNGGIYDRTNTKWVVYSTTAGDAELAGHASCATYASSAGSSGTSVTASNAVYAASAGYAKLALTASNAKYAASAGYAKSALTASNAVKADNANTAGSSITASNAVYALSAGSANSAGSSNSAGSAGYAVTASNAKYAASAGYAKSSLTASNAIYAASAGYAKSALTASNAMLAASANYAKSALTASNAMLAASANYTKSALTASYAVTASNAKYASSASYAATAGKVGTATVGGILEPVYVNSGAVTSSSGKTIPFIKGPTTDTTAGTWTGTLTGLTAYDDGLLILYKPAIAGASTTTLNINSLGAKTVYLNNTTKLTTHYPVNQPILLAYSTSQNSGCWVAIDNYDSNSDTKVRQSLKTDNVNRPLLMAYSDNTVTTANVDNVSYRANVMYANASTGRITATEFAGKLVGTANNAITASNAVNAASAMTATASITAAAALKAKHSTGTVVTGITFGAGSTPSLGTAIPADDITSWSPNKIPTATVSNGVLIFYAGTTASLSYTAKSIPNVTGVGTVPTLSYATATYVKSIG